MGQIIESNTNPRLFFSNHKERGPQQWTYTYKDIANICGVSINTVKHYSEIMGSLPRVARYLFKHKIRQSKLIIDITTTQYFQDIPIKYKDKFLNNWNNRYPQFNIYNCGYKNCNEFLFAPGLCQEHEGGKPIIRINNEIFEVLVNRKYIAYHRLVINCPYNYCIYHSDNNRFNNHPNNLYIGLDQYFQPRSEPLIFNW